MVLSSWLRGARAIEYGLLIPGRPSWRGCDLLLTPAGALVSARGRVVDLPYEDCRRPGPSDWTADAWQIGYAAAAQAGVLGSGHYAERLDDLHPRLSGLRGVAERLDAVPGVATLYRSRINTHPRLGRDVDLVAALCKALAIRPGWRRQLIVPGRVSRLLDEIAARPRRPIAPKAGLRTATMEVLLAMKRLGYEYPVGGRPLPDGPRPDPDEVIGKVMAALAANPYGSHPDEAIVGGLVHKHYLDVTPWPFAALLPEPRD